MVGDIGNGGSYACVEVGGAWEIPVPSPQFCSES